MNKKRNLLIMIITFSLILILGSSYSYLTYTKESNNNYVINVGTLEVTFVDSETEFLNLTNMYPMTDDEGKSLEQELVFQVKNTGNVDSYYDVTLEEISTNPEFKSVIRYIINKDDKGYNEPKILSEDKYIELGGYLKPNGIADYRVKVWLAEEADNTYMNKEFKAKVVVNSFQESEYAKDVIKNQLVKYEESSKDTFTGGLVAVNTDGDLYNEIEASQEIREYRYSGPNVNNYVTFNDESWRIIGVFKDESEGEHLKIVRNEILDLEIIPNFFKINDISYIIKLSSREDYTFWNKIDGKSNAKNDWTTAGLQYYLNTEHDESETSNYGYEHYLSNDALKMIYNTTYYLGNGNRDNLGTWEEDTTIESYENEHKNIVCSSNITRNTKNNNCNIWNGNKPTWNGKIGLLYPSDVGYSINANYWSTNKLLNPSITKSWLKNMLSNENNDIWLISPASYTPYDGFILNTSSFHVNTRYVFEENGSLNATMVLPALYLKSNVKITSGTGEKNKPYILDF